MNTASLKKEYAERIAPALMKEFGYKSTMQIPVLEKIVFLAWRIPGTEEPSGLPSMGSHRVRHD